MTSKPIVSSVYFLINDAASISRHFPHDFLRGGVALVELAALEPVLLQSTSRGVTPSTASRRGGSGSQDDLDEPAALGSR